MNKILGVLVLSVILISGCQAPVVEDLLVDDFEGQLDKTTVDFGSSKGSDMQATAATDIKVSGEQSLKLEYNLRPSGWMWAARGYKLDVKGAGKWIVAPHDIEWSKYNAVKISMYGANSGGVFAFDLKDSGGEIWRTILDDDFSGWKEIIIPFRHFFDRKDWQPDSAQKNELLDFPIYSFQFEPRLPGKGVVYFDKVTLSCVDESK